MKLTWRFLVKLNACKEQIELFRELCPRGLDLRTFSYAKLKELQDENLSIGWMVNQFMDDKLDDKYVKPFRDIKDAVWKAIDMGFVMNPDDPDDAARRLMYQNLSNAINNVRDYVLWKVVFNKLSKKLTRAAALAAKKGKK